jgi:hypothetical protein
MAGWRSRMDNWLSLQQQDLDEAADAALAEVFAALPPVEPSPDFVQRAVAAAWAEHARARRTALLAGAAAAALVALTSAAVAYTVFGMAGGWLLTTAAAALSGSAVTLLDAASTAVQWWLATVRIGDAVAAVVTRPVGAAAVVTIELMGAVALYTLRRLLQADLRFKRPSTLFVMA